MAVAAASLHEKQLKYEKLRPKIFSENSFIVDEELAEEAPLCEMCCDLMGPSTDNASQMACGHRFCAKCWRDYLHARIKEGEARGDVICPTYECQSGKARIFRFPCSIVVVYFSHHIGSSQLGNCYKLALLPGGAATCSERICKMFSVSSPEVSPIRKCISKIPKVWSL